MGYTPNSRRGTSKSSVSSVNFEVTEFLKLFAVVTFIMLMALVLVKNMNSIQHFVIGPNPGGYHPDLLN